MWYANVTQKQPSPIVTLLIHHSSQAYQSIYWLSGWTLIYLDGPLSMFLKDLYATDFIILIVLQKEGLRKILYLYRKILDYVEHEK